MQQQAQHAPHRPQPGRAHSPSYYDDIFGKRLFVPRFELPGKIPRITLRLLLDALDPNYTAVRFNMVNIVKRTSIMRYLKTSCVTRLRPAKISKTF